MKRGFTLIELLAVIVILAIIALIAIPIVIKIISDVNVSSVEVSMNNVDKAVELYYQGKQNPTEEIFTCDKGKCKSNLNNTLKVNGSLPDSGTITISSKGEIIYDSIKINGYFCDKVIDSFSCRKASENIITSTNKITTITNNKDNVLTNYRIYGNSVQEDAPSYNIPIEIKSVEDKTTNLLSLKNNDYTVIQAGKAKEINKRLADNFYLPANKTLYFNLFFDDGTKLNSNYSIKLRQNSYVSEGDLVIDVLNKGITLTEEQSKLIRYIYIYINANGGTQYAEKMPIGIIANENSSATDFEYYNKYKIPIKVNGKNLFNKELSPVAAIRNETPQSYWVSTILSRDNFKNMINEAGTYTLSYDIEFTSVPENYGGVNSEADGGRYGIMLSTTDYKTIKVSPKIGYKDVGFKQHIKAKFTISESELDKAFAIYGYSNNYYKNSDKTQYTSSKAIISNIQIEKGENATEYEPYKEEITNIYLNEPLRKIGAYVDYVDFFSKKVVRNVGNLILTGQENWKIKDNVFYTSIDSNYKDEALSLSTHFTYNNNFWIENNKLYIKVEGLTSVEEFKSWLKEQYNSNIPVSIYYPLKKSKIEEVDLSNINLNSNYTNILIDTSVIPSKIQYEYN